MPRGRDYREHEPPPLAFTFTFAGLNVAVYVTSGIKLSRPRDRGNEASLIGWIDGDANSYKLAGEGNYLVSDVDGTVLAAALRNMLTQSTIRTLFPCSHHARYSHDSASHVI